ncbi:MAG: hypothetical protein IKO10_01290 [Lachnospiraceae bacterium]|nr:hypothetical protein [Lachnospiraceae bacterium]
MIPKGLLRAFDRKPEAKSDRLPVIGRIRQQYQKMLLVLLAAAFFVSVLFLADRLPAPKLKKAAEEPIAVNEALPVKKKSNKKQILMGCAIALVMLLAVGGGIWAVVQSRGGRSAKESIGQEEAVIGEDNIGDNTSELWKITSDATFELPEEPAEEETISVSEDVTEEEPEEEPEEEEAVMPGRLAIPGDVIFVGDSRFVGMSTAVRYDDLYIAQVAIGYDWFRDTAIPELDTVAVPGAKVVINMGVNDLENAGRYAALINENMDRWTAAGLTIYYMSVNPVIDGKSYATNAMIESFNAKLQETLDPRVYWIDTYTPLMESGVQSPDGVHYRDETSRLIYEYCRKALMENEVPTPMIQQLELTPTEGEVPEGILPETGEMPQPVLVPQTDIPPEALPAADVQPPAETVPVQP